LHFDSIRQRIRILDPSIKALGVADLHAEAVMIVVICQNARVGQKIRAMIAQSIGEIR
jgi:hypothetical protein